MKQMKRSLSRREFIRLAAVSAAGAILAGCAPEQAETAAPASPTESPAGSSPTQDKGASVVPSETALEATQSPTARAEPPQPNSDQAYLSVVHGADPAAITKAALDALGGIERFVKSGMDVIIKPNICTDYNTAEYATTTNPIVVATLVTLALGAGAKRVRVMDYPFGGTAESAYAISGIADAVEAAGGEMHVMSLAKYKTYSIEGAQSMRSTDVYPDIMEADVLINVPIAKHHSSSRLTLAAKNLMGVVRDRNTMHMSLHKRIADLASLVRPSLTVIDGVRILMDNGPTGGNLNDVKQLDTIIASHDLVCADAYAAGWFGMTAEDIPYIKMCADLGVGTLDWQNVRLEELSL
jgi:uncharacterized protein (DUF362 family)